MAKLFQTKKNYAELSAIISQTYFRTFVSDLKIPSIYKVVSDIRSNRDPVLAFIKTFQNHPSIVHLKQTQFFSVNNTNENVVHKIIKNLNVRKTFQGSDIRNHKINLDLFSSFTCRHSNYCISIGEFPNELKHADITPVHTKKDKCDKTNSWAVSIPPNISKIYKKII